MKRALRGIGYALLLCGTLFADQKPAISLAENNGHVLILIPAGKYALGSAHHKANRPRTITSAGFRISDAETTNAQFAAFVKATGYITKAEKAGHSLSMQEGYGKWDWRKTEKAHWRDPFGNGTYTAKDHPDYPVTQICGDDARAYCQWAGGRLPTIDEWEIAARGIKPNNKEPNTIFPWGNDWKQGQANIWEGNSHAKNRKLDGYVYTSPVRSYPANALGLYDVLGNVFEYCENKPAWMAGEKFNNRICGRGGSWWCGSFCCDFANLNDIGSMFQNASLPNQGFRFVKDLTK